MATANATALLRRYFAALDSVRANPAASIDSLSAVAIGIELNSDQRLVEGQRARGLRQTGTTRIAQLQVVSVNRDNSAPTAGKVPAVSVAVCWDVTGADLVDKSGHSVVSSSRPKRGWTIYTVANYEWTSHPADGWRVADSQDLKRSPCVGH